MNQMNLKETFFRHHMPPRKDCFLLKIISDEKFPRFKKIWFFNFEKIFEIKMIEKSKGKYGYKDQKR